LVPLLLCATTLGGRHKDHNKAPVFAKAGTTGPVFQPPPKTTPVVGNCIFLSSISCISTKLSYLGKEKSYTKSVLFKIIHRLIRNSKFNPYPANVENMVSS